MTSKLPLLLAVLVAVVSLVMAAFAWAADTLVVHESFTPDRLGAPTNLSLTANFISSTGAPTSPIDRLTLYAPAGMAIDTRGASTCNPNRLRERGPSGCPLDSRAGFGGGVAAFAFPKETVRESFTLDFFFAPSEHGRLALAAYASATSPLAVELVVVAKQVPAPKPYGLGFSFEVPPIAPLPEVSYVSVESAFATFGATNAAYYETVRGKRTLVHLKGLLAPKTCSRGGFPTEGTIDFADGSTITVNPTIPCPRH